MMGMRGRKPPVLSWHVKPAWNPNTWGKGGKKKRKSKKVYERWEAPLRDIHATCHTISHTLYCNVNICILHEVSLVDEALFNIGGSVWWLGPAVQHAAAICAQSRTYWIPASKAPPNHIATQMDQEQRDESLDKTRMIINCLFLLQTRVVYQVGLCDCQIQIQNIIKPAIEM